MRRLAICCFSFSAAVFAANYALPISSLCWIAGALAAAGILLLLRREKWLLGFALCLFGLAAGLLCFFLHAQRSLVPAAELDGQTLEIRGKLLSYPRCYDRYARAEILLTGEGTPHVRALLYDEGEVLAQSEPGDRISCSAKLTRADQRYGDRYDYNISRDVYLTASAKSPLERTPGGFDLRLLPVRLHHVLGNRILALFPEDTGPFFKSLMLGDKSELYEDEGLSLAMSRAGFMHIVAVSGMHLAFLIGFLQLLFGKGPRSSLLCLLLVWLFVLVTGSSPSAVRAAVMQSFLLTAPLVSRENDPPTSLSAALALILLWNPYAAGSVSLQLSFGAMAGILCFAEPLQKTLSGFVPEHWAHRLRTPISTAASSLAVLVFTVPLMAIHFRAVSILSPLSNVLGLWAVSACFCGGYLSCLLSLVSTGLGSACAWVCAWLARYLFFVARLVSSIPFSTLYLRSLGPLLWIILVYLLVLIACFSKLSPGRKWLYPVLLSTLCLGLMLWSNRHSYVDVSGTIGVLDVGHGQCLAVMAGEETVVVDCGGLYTLENAGEQAGAYLRNCGRDHIDLLLLTHLHNDHCNGVTMLMEMLPVSRIIFPADVPDEDGLLEEILASAEKHGTQITGLREDTRLQAGKIDIQLFAPGEKGDANERCMMALLSLGSYDMLVTGDCSKAAERELLTRYPLRELELLIVGHHGSRYASSGELLGSIGADTAIISVGYNPYGHPTYETLERLNAYGYQIYRTDLNGTVEIRVGENYGEKER